jgi:hypothetical protein
MRFATKLQQIPRGEGSSGGAAISPSNQLAGVGSIFTACLIFDELKKRLAGV